jgi:hypothetical protein
MKVHSLCQGRRRYTSLENSDVKMANKRSLPNTTAESVADRSSHAGASRELLHDNQSSHLFLGPQRARLPGLDLNPIAVITLSVAAWFLAVIWLNFAGSPKLGLILATVSGVFVMFLTAALLVVSSVIDDAQRRRPKARFDTGSLFCSVSHC